MKLSHKDILLIIGILVALIVTLTTVVFQEGTRSGPAKSMNSKNTSDRVPLSVRVGLPSFLSL